MADDTAASDTKKARVESVNRGFATEPASWATVLAFARDQAGEASVGRGPKRTTEVEERYNRYKEWCAQRGHTGVELVLILSAWVQVDGRRIALEPNVVPYHLQDGMEHWVLWYHPDDTAPSTNLQGELCENDVRAFFCTCTETLGPDELIAFQNPKEFRSVPEIAHAHVFLRPRTDEHAATLAALRKDRRLRSPWAEAERLGGRAAQVGF